MSRRTAIFRQLQVHAEDMTVYVNERRVALLTGMTVKHALIGAGLLKAIEAGQKAYDEWGNELGIDGSLTEEMKIYVR
jgi:hypothetical protein